MPVSHEYINQMNAKRQQQINAMLAELPTDVRSFIRSIEDTTSSLTRFNYVIDLRLFYNYLAKYEYSPLVMENGGQSLVPRKITSTHINMLNISDLHEYISFLQSYDKNFWLNDPDDASVTNEAAETDADESKTNRSNSDCGKKRKIASLRSYFKYLYNMEIIKENISTKLPTPKIDEKPIVRLENSEVYDIIKLVMSGEGLSPAQQKRHERHKYRDAAMIVLFLTTGIRVSELVSLDVSDLDFKSNAFTVTRKGGNTVILYFEDFTAGYIKEYLEQRKASADFTLSSPLFLSQKGGRITTRQVENIVEKYAQIAAPLKHITPHKLRSTYGTMLYNDTGDIYLVAEALGHRDVNTTRRHYAAISEERRREAAKYLSLNNDGSAKIGGFSDAEDE